MTRGKGLINIKYYNIRRVTQHDPANPLVVA